MNVGIQTRHMPARSSPNIEDKKLKQDPFTKTMSKGGNSGQGSIQKSLEEMQAQIKAFYRVAIESAKRPSLDEKNQGDHATQMVQLMSASTTAQAAKISAQAAEVQEAAAKTAQAQMVGKSVKVHSNRNFSAQPGERVAFKYELDIPKNAAASGTVTVLDSNKKKVRTEKIKYMKDGKNEYSWDGLTDIGKVAPEGEYTINIKASYKSPGSKDLIPAKVNTMIEAKIEEVDIEAGKILLSDNSYVSIGDVVKFFDAEAAKKSKKNATAPDISRAKDFLYKNITIKEDQVKFEGLNRTSLGFNMPHAKQNAKVKVVVTQDRETKSVEIKQMNLKEGRNTFIWSGEAVVSDDDIQAKAAGAAFPKLSRGNYEYAIYVSTDGSTWDRIDPKSQVYVEGTEHADGQTMLALKGGGSVPESCFYGFAKESETKKPDELLAKAQSFINKKIDIPLTAVFDGTSPVSREYVIPFDDDIETGIEIVYKDKSGKRLRVQDISEAEMNAALRKSFIYDNLRDESKTKLNAWVETQFDDGNGIVTEYADLLGTTFEGILPCTAAEAKTQADDHIFAELKAGNYSVKEGLVPLITVEWDGKDDKGNALPPGEYPYFPSYIERNTKPNGISRSLPMHEKVGMVITAAKVVNNEMVFFLQDPMKLEKSREMVFTGKEVITN